MSVIKILRNRITLLLLLLLVVTCNKLINNPINSGSIRIQIVFASDSTERSMPSSNSDNSIKKITISIPGMAPIDIDVTPGETVTRTIDGVPIGNIDVIVDLKNAEGTIIYTQTISFLVKEGETSEGDASEEGFKCIVGDKDCFGVCEGSAVDDVCDVCGGDGTTCCDNACSGETPDCNGAGTCVCNAVLDCAGVCEGSAVEDECGECEGDGSTCLPSITVTSPNGEEIWGLDSNKDITWSSNNITGNVKIELYSGSSLYQTIAGSTSNDGYYVWSIPSTYAEGSSYRIKISSVNDDSISDYSNSYFSLSSSSVQGCTDNQACNYNLNATEDDGSCTYAEINYDCDGDCITDTDCAGECDGSAVLSGCDNLCGSTAVDDCAGECDGSAVLSGCDIYADQQQ